MLEPPTQGYRAPHSLRDTDLERYTTPTAGVMLWGVIAYNTLSSLVLIRGTMTSQCYVYEVLQAHVLSLMHLALGSYFETRQYSASHGKVVTRLSPHCHYPSLACLISRFVSH
ncbi:transposable element Tcb1 transposase [Trichonephila clavipes]|nr:transposable element Tcb1 transposase [Trichonephila clavipes]